MLLKIGEYKNVLILIKARDYYYLIGTYIFDWFRHVNIVATLHMMSTHTHSFVRACLILSGRCHQQANSIHF